MNMEPTRLGRIIERLMGVLEVHRRFHRKVGCPGLPECYVCAAEEKMSRKWQSVDEVDDDGTPVERLGEEVKIVRGLWYHDGKPFRRWMPAAFCKGSWVGHDDGEIISHVDAVIEMSQLDGLV